MLILAKSALALMVSFLITAIFGAILLPFLKKIKAKQTISIFLSNIHKKKQGIPTMGGLIFIIPTIVSTVILLLLNKIQFSSNLFLIMFIFLSYGLLGFLDDFLKIKRKNNIGLTEIQKLIGQIIIAIVFFIIFIKTGHNTVLEVHSLGFKIDMGIFYGLFILFILVASSNAVNITDGLDGLAGGLSLIAFITFSLISWNTGWLEGYSDIALFGFALAGSLLGFLVFNKPAKIFMGDTGSLALGATLGTYAILTRHELLLLIIGIVFVIETLSCVIQRFYYKLTKKRIFPMTPIHHTFEKIGWKEEDIVKVFWIIGLIGSMIALSVGVLL